MREREVGDARKQDGIEGCRGTMSARAAAPGRAIVVFVADDLAELDGADDEEEQDIVRDDISEDESIGHWRLVGGPPRS